MEPTKTMTESDGKNHLVGVEEIPSMLPTPDGRDTQPILAKVVDERF